MFKSEASHQRRMLQNIPMPTENTPTTPTADILMSLLRLIVAAVVHRMHSFLIVSGRERERER